MNNNEYETQKIILNIINISYLSQNDIHPILTRKDNKMLRKNII